MNCTWLALALLAIAPAVHGQSVIRTEFHLTARPWQPLNIAREKYLDAIEGICRFSVQHQDAAGAIIDPFLNREHQYATPYFAYAVGTLTAAGRARDLLPNGVRAMEHSTARLRGRARCHSGPARRIFHSRTDRGPRTIRPAGSGRDPRALARAD